jgi:four helix bundle suffix protein
MLEGMSDEKMANLALTLCHQTDKMMCSYIERLEERFVTEGGIKERMHAARTGYRKEQDAYMKALETENQMLKKRIKELEEELGELGPPRGY